MSRASVYPRSLLLACLLAAGPLAAQAPAPPAGAAQSPLAYTTGSEVTLVEVPVNATTADGSPVRDLTASDFELFDNGKKVEVAGFDVLDLDRPSGAPAAGDAPPPLPPAARRNFLLLFDLSFSRPLKVARAREAAHQFVAKTLKPSDLAGVATYDAARGTTLVLSFTADRAQLQAAIDSLGLLGKGPSSAPDPLSLTLVAPSLAGPRTKDGDRGDAAFAERIAELTATARQNNAAADRGRVAGAVAAFAGLAASLDSVRGKKQVLLFSEGFDSRLLAGDVGENAGREVGDQVASGEIWKVDNTQRFGSSDLQSRLDEMLRLFRRSDCVIQAVNVAGLDDANADARSATMAEAAPDRRDVSPGRGKESLFRLANGTGGHVFENTNDLASALEAVQRQTSLVYVLVFAPQKVREPGSYHSLTVKVKRPGVKVSARDGYYQARPFAKLTALERRLATAQLLAYGLPRADLPVRALTAPFRAGSGGRSDLPVILEIPGERLQAGASGTLKLELYAYLLDDEPRVVDYFSQGFALDLAKVGTALASGGLKYYGTLHAPPGRYSLRVLLRNAETGRTGLQVVPVVVPKSEPYVSWPLFHEAPGRWIMVKGADRADPSVGYPFVAHGETYIPTASPAVKGGAASRFSLVVYNVAPGTPVSVSGRVRAPDGKELGDVVCRQDAAEERAPDGSRRIAATLEAGRLVPGSYTLAMKVKAGDEELGGERIVPLEVR